MCATWMSKVSSTLRVQIWSCSTSTRMAFGTGGDGATQRFMAFGTGGDGATALAVSPNKRYAAIAEKKDKPTITIFDLQTMRKRKVLTCPDVASQEYVWMGFSPDSKFFIGQGGGPDWVLVYWHWEKAKIMATAKVSAPANNPVHQVGHLQYTVIILPCIQVSFNPQDNTFRTELIK